MKYNIPPVNFLFLLAYAFGLDWEQLQGQVKEEDFEEATFLQLFTFLLSKWTDELVRKGLYRTFKKEIKDTKRIKGRILFGPSLKKQPFKTTSLICQYDDLSFDILENQILLSTLKFCLRQLAVHSHNKRNEITERLEADLPKQIRLLSSSISYIPLSRTLFQQLTYHRVNAKYKPLLALCRLIYDSSGLQKLGELEMFDLDEKEMNNLFEEFLRNYLREELEEEGLLVSKKAESHWTIKAGTEASTSYMPRIEPDIVVGKKESPGLILDAKFYAKPVYRTGARFENKESENYKTKSHNLYQIFTYCSFYNCDGLLVYAQTKQGHFAEQVKINPVYYSEGSQPEFDFGFYTLDLSGSLSEFQERMNGFVEGVKKRVAVEF